MVPDLSNNLYIKNLWPVTYIITGEKSKEMYIGESTNAISRMGSHLSNPIRNSLDSVCIISSDKFNKSAVLDIESNLIKYFAADGKCGGRNGGGAGGVHRSAGCGAGG